MKLRIFGKPSIPVGLLGLVAFGLLGVWFSLAFPFNLVLLPFVAFYCVLFGLSAWMLGRLQVLERWIEWDMPQRLLILAPHEDDCVISAGALGVRNQARGGVTRIVYLAPEEEPAKAERRADEARDAWREAGLDSANLLHLDLLPRLRQRDPQKLRSAGAGLRSIIDDFAPTILVMPMFEGGHVQHDMLANLVRSILTPSDRFEVFEAPEYSPYTSLLFTPHRIITLSARWLFGLVSYYGPPDGIDSRPILKFRCTEAELDCKRRMLSAFVSQNAPSLMETRAYPDRLVPLDRGARPRHPFAFRGSYLALSLAARRLLPARLAGLLLPGPDGTVGREGSITDWNAEFDVDQPNVSWRCGWKAEAE